MPKTVLAYDFGASSGRAIAGEYRDEKITLSEIHRFSNDPVVLGDTLHWDFLRLIFEIKAGLLKAVNGGYDISGIGFDTWGVDFGLLDEYGVLLENPVHYRDARNDSMIEKAIEIIPEHELFGKTGIQFMKFNTVFQLLSLKLNRPHILQRAKDLLFMPDLMIYFLTGAKGSEYSIASTSGLLSPFTGEWESDIFNKLGIDKNIMAPVTQTGKTIAPLSKEICNELNIEPINVTAVCEHDTGSAVAAVPSEDKEFLYISCGTWSLLGTELEKPVISNEIKALGFSNEGGYNKTVRLLKNIIGLWLIQESQRQWSREGDNLTFKEIDKYTEAAESFKCYIDPTDEMFIAPGDIPAKIREYCKSTGQYIPQTKGEITRCITESLAMEYAYAINNIERVLGKEFPTVHIIGGGVKDKLLCKFTANTTGKKVTAGPIEATAIGNIAVQLIAGGEIKDLKTARGIVRDSFDIEVYEPSDRDIWSAEYKKYVGLIHKDIIV